MGANSDLVALWESRLAELSEAALSAADRRHRRIKARIGSALASCGNLDSGNRKSTAKPHSP